MTKKLPRKKSPALKWSGCSDIGKVRKKQRGFVSRPAI